MREVPQLDCYVELLFLIMALGPLILVPSNEHLNPQPRDTLLHVKGLGGERGPAGGLPDLGAHPVSLSLPFFFRIVQVGLGGGSRL